MWQAILDKIEPPPVQSVPPPKVYAPSRAR